MSEIQKTFGITDTLDAKIDLLKDELEKQEKCLNKIVLEKDASKTKRFLLKFLTYFFWFLVILASLIFYVELFPYQCDKNSGYSLIECSDYRHKHFPFLVISFFLDLIFISFAIIFNLANRSSNRFKQEKEIEIERINDLILKINNDLDKARQEKKSILLEYEKQILEQENKSIQVITEFDKELEKECPMCAEFIKSKAKICRFCGHNF